MGLIVVQKKSSKRAKVGDVFRVDLTTGQIIWGRVVSLDGHSGSAKGLTLLYFFRPLPAGVAPPANLPVSELLLPPLFTNGLGFARGYFTIVDNRPFALGERLKTHSFFWVLDGKYHDETGAELPGPIEPECDGAIHSYLSIEDAIATSLGLPTADDEVAAARALAPPLPDARFWSIVDAAKGRAKGKSSAWASSLAKELKPLSVTDVTAFDAAFAARMRRAHDYALWGAAYLLDDGCSEGAFLGFRAWLIFQGRDVYEDALKDPETLARFGEHGDFDAEEVLSAAKKIVDAKSDDFFDAAPNDNDAPTGAPFDEGKLTALYPKLAKAVGAT